MYWRMVTSSILRRRSRVLIAVLAVAIGATTLSGLAAIAIDVPSQMAQEMRLYGANLVVVPSEKNDNLTDQTINRIDEVVKSSGSTLVGSAAFDYQPVSINDQPYVAAGTDIDAVKAINPYWYIEGEWPSADGQVLIGREIASTIDAKVGDSITVSQLAEGASSAAPQSGRQDASTAPGTTAMSGAPEIPEGSHMMPDGTIMKNSEMPGYDPSKNVDGIYVGDQPQSAQSGAPTTKKDAIEQLTQNKPTAPVAPGNGKGQAPDPVDTRDISLTVSGILETGGSEDGFLFMSTADMSQLTGKDTSYGVSEYSVAGQAEAVSALAKQINDAVDGVKASTVTRLTHSDEGVLTMLRSLMGMITIIVLALTMIGVSTTMMAVVAERRNEIGLRKALGAHSKSIVREFLGEGVMLGILGGAIGAVLGYLLAIVICLNVFHRTIAFHPLMGVVTVLASVIIATLACLIPVRRALDVDPALVLRGE